MTQTKIGIIGGGSIGSYFAIKLSSAGYKPIILGRINHQEKNAVLISDRKIISGVVKQVNNYENTFDLLIIAVKSYNLEKVYNDYGNIMNNSQNIVFVQSNLNFIKDSIPFDPARIFFCPILFSAVGNYHSVVYELNKGNVILGTKQGQKENISFIKNIFENISPTFLSSSIYFDLFVKVIVNTSLFPLSIILKTDFGTAFSKNNHMVLATKIFSECIQLAKLAFNHNENLLFGRVLKDIYEDELTILLKEILEKYSKVIPSVLFDLLQGKSITELPFFFDDVINMGLEHNYEMPILKQVQNELNRTLQNKQSFDDSYRLLMELTNKLRRT